MSRQRHLRWGLPETPIPKHPYRDSMLVYAVLALLVVLFAWLTGGPIGRAVVIAAAVWVAATAWSVVRWRQRLAREAARRAADDEAAA